MIEIQFKALGNATQYALQIGAAEQGSNATQLKGTRDVFVTNEDDDEDVFMPVRCTSGTVRFYNSGNAWSELADITELHRPVRLLAGGSEVWWGYINKGYIGTRRIFGHNEECEISVQCPLSELDTEMFAPLSGQQGSAGMMTLYSILQSILTIGGTSLSFDIPSALQDGAVYQMYNLSVSPLAFYEESTNDEGVKVFEPKYTKKQALENVLRLLCCSARWDGLRVVITAPKPLSLSSQTDTLAISPADTECTETAVMPYKKISVKAEANGTGAFIQLPTNAIQKWTDAHATDAITTLVDNVGITIFHKVSWIWGAIGLSLIDDEYGYSYEYSGQYSGDSLVHVTGYQNLDDNAPQGTYINLGPAVFLHYVENLPLGNPYGEPGDFTVHNPTLVLETQSPVIVQDAYLALSARLKLNFYQSNFGGVLEVCARIGNYAYDLNQSAWVYQSQASDLFFPVEYENGEIKTSSNLNNYYGNVKGYAIPVLWAVNEQSATVSAALSGLLQIKIRTRFVGSGTDFDEDVITIDSLEVEAVRKRATLNEKDTYTATGNGRGDEDMQLIFCSERQVTNADNFLYYGSTIIRNLSLDGTTQRPEQWVANRHAAMTTGKARSLLMVRQVGDINDGTYTYNGKTYQTLLKKHEWAENITEVHLIETS